jgi:hypothetical protein
MHLARRLFFCSQTRRLRHVLLHTHTKIDHKVATGWHKRSCAALLGATTLVSLSLCGPATTPAAAQQQPQRPNILFIMGDDIGWMQPSTYHQRLMVGETPTSTLAPTGG